MDVERELEAVYNKFNVELAKLMGPELKQCIDKNSDNPTKMMNCYDEFQKRISPAMQRFGVFKTETKSTFEKCIESKENAKICATIGLNKSQDFINEAFNDFKNYLA